MTTKKRNKHYLILLIAVIGLIFCVFYFNFTENNSSVNNSTNSSSKIEKTNYHLEQVEKINDENIEKISNLVE